MRGIAIALAVSFGLFALGGGPASAQLRSYPRPVYTTPAADWMPAYVMTPSSSAQPLGTSPQLDLQSADVLVIVGLGFAAVSGLAGAALGLVGTTSVGPSDWTTTIVAGVSLGVVFLVGVVLLCVGIAQPSAGLPPARTPLALTPDGIALAF